MRVPRSLSPWLIVQRSINLHRRYVSIIRISQSASFWCKRFVYIYSFKFVAILSSLGAYHRQLIFVPSQFQPDILRISYRIGEPKENVDINLHWTFGECLCRVRFHVIEQANEFSRQPASTFQLRCRICAIFRLRFFFFFAVRCSVVCSVCLSMWAAHKQKHKCWLSELNPFNYRLPCQVTKILDWILPSRQAHSRQSYVCVCALYDFYAFRSIHSRQVCSYLTVYQWKIFIFHFAFSSCVDSFSCFFFLARFRQSHSCLGDCVIVDKSDSVTLLYVYICSIMFTVAVCGHINLQYSGFGCACVCVCVCDTE